MALIKCPECNGTVSDKASSCPHCGCPASAFKVLSDQNELRCPECHHILQPNEIKCPVCHYGLPAQWKNHNCQIRGRLFDLQIIEELIAQHNVGNAQICAMQITNLSFEGAKKLVELIQEDGEIPLEFDPEQYGIHLNTPKCPTCGSTSLDKITAFDRGVAAGAFGLISKTARSQFQCKKCGYKW